MKTELHFQKKSLNGWIRRSVIISRQGQKDVELWLEVPEHYSAWLANHEEPLLRLALFGIMEHGGECFIHADIERMLLENLTEHMRLWHLWAPSTYHCPALIADSIVTRPATGRMDEAICAFSGGVDASFSLVSNISGYWGALSLKIPAAIMLHGADIALNKQDDFDYAYGHAAACLKELNTELIPVRTNFRHYPNNWEHSHYSVVVAALSLFNERFSRGILGSDNVATKENIASSIPYGMNFVTDHLYNSSSFLCQAVGNTTYRTERCALIAQYPPIMKHLRVCWQANAGGSNCGRCEKCMRTALNFMASGYKGELPFSSPFSLKHFRKLPINSHAAYIALEEILAYNQTSQQLEKETLSAIEHKLKRARSTYGNPFMSKGEHIPTLKEKLFLRFPAIMFPLRRIKHSLANNRCKP